MESARMSIQEMAKVLEINDTAAYKLVKQPGFPAFPVGGQYIISRYAFEAWISDPDRIIHFKSLCQEKEQAV